MIVRLLNYLGIVKGVYLRDRWGEVFITWERRNPWAFSAFKYPFMRIGQVTLEKDGKTGGEATHIKEWVYMDDWEA